MQKRTVYLLGLLTIFFLGSSVVLGGDSGFCPIHSTEHNAILDSPDQEVLAPKESYSIPRNQVLLEIFTATW